MEYEDKFLDIGKSPDKKIIKKIIRKKSDLENKSK